MHNTLGCKQRSLGPLERLHEELADMRLLNSSLLKEARPAGCMQVPFADRCKLMSMAVLGYDIRRLCSSRSHRRPTMGNLSDSATSRRRLTRATWAVGDVHRCAASLCSCLCLSRDLDATGKLLLADVFRCRLGLCPSHRASCGKLECLDCCS